METNYFGTIRCIQAVLPAMREKGSGCIVNVTSVAGKIYGGFQGTYAASKAATEAFSESLAAEVQPFGIRVVMVEPGVIDTPILDKMETPSADTKYPIMNRVNAFFSASQTNHVSPSLVGETIRDILTDNSTQMRYPVGPDSALLLGWRASLSDYEWISSGNVDEETWIAGMGQLGLDVRQYLNS
jgi:NAD(P)-dependent dehydrogenase (short-subunit alcohol dehydrogenase family)